MRNDTTSDIMNFKKIEGCRRDLENLRARGGVRNRELKQLAERMGLYVVHAGTHQNWGSANPIFKGLNVFQIPSHPRDLNKYTKNGILNSIEGYLIRLERQYEEKESSYEEEFDE